MLNWSNKKAAVRLPVLIVPLLFGALCVVSPAQTPAPDNTKVNQRDRNAAEPTADQQKMNSTDQKLSASIRKSIMADKTLSTDAHNIKVIAQDGAVTLKGPVKSDDERKSLIAKATAVAGSADKVHDEISVK